MYDCGDGVEQNYQKAVEYYQKAAEQDYPQAQNNLGLLYEHGKGVEQSYKKAIELYQKAADQGFAQAHSNLGLLYEHGNGVEQNYQKAVEHCQKAADQGWAPAQWKLGFFYEYGKGVGQNYQKAAEYYQKAADQGLAPAQYNLGLMYELGEGVEKNFERACDLYKKASALGCEEAIKKLKDLDDTEKNTENGLNQDYIRLNTRKDHPLIGDETYFIRIREAGTDDELTDNITLVPGKLYDIFIIYDNSSESGIAKDVRVRAYMEDDNKITAQILCSNANKTSLKSDLIINYDFENYDLMFNHKNAKIVSNWPINGMSLSPNKIFSEEGVPVGVREPDGKLIAGLDYAGYVFF